MKTWMIFGDSVMKGVIYDGRCYHLCQGHNLDFLQKDNVLIENYAKMGASIELTLSLMRPRLERAQEPAAVLIGCGGNDCDFDWQAVSDNPEGEHLPKTSPEDFITLYRSAIRLVQDHGATPALATLLPLDVPRYLDHISRGRSRENILRWLGDCDHLYRWQEYYSSLICHLARAFGCPLIDIRAEFLRSRNFPELISPDGIHPTQAGYDLIHKVIAGAVRY